MKRWIALLACFLLFPCLSGCSGSTIFSEYHEVDKIEIIRTIGIDKADNGVAVTICSGISRVSQTSKIYKAEGKTAFSALNKLLKNLVGYTPFIAHTEHILIGEAAAREGIGGHLDFILRTPEMRSDVNLFIVKGGTAEDLITGVPGENTAAADMLKLLQTDIRGLGSGYVYTCEDVAADLAINGSSLAMAVEAVKTDELSKGRSEKMIRPAGFAVIKDGKITCFLTEKETRGASLILEKVNYECIDLDSADLDSLDLNSEDSTISLGMDKENVSVKPVFEGSGISHVDILVKTQSNIEEVVGMVDVFSKNFREQLSACVSKLEAERILAVISLSQELGYDFLGLGSTVERKAPVKFSELSPSWEEIFPDITFNVTVSSIIRRTYAIDNPISTSGKEDARP